jgi:uncharacterized protein (TIGR02452 family)
MMLADVAKETLEITARRGYTAGGGEVDLGPLVAAALAGTCLFRPEQLAALVAGPAGSAARRATAFEVTAETTGAACRRLAEAGVPDVVALNFASATKPGGGFLNGARAQEEDLARCSALYDCQLTQPAFYDANRAFPSAIYTDHLIYSPAVPFFRNERLALLDAPFTASIITSPAPNAGAVLRNDPGAGPAVRAALAARAAHVLAVAEAKGHGTLVLGAWGCGVFKNDPEAVAAVFADHLASPRLSGAFARVVFAVYDRSPEATNRRPSRGASPRADAWRSRTSTRAPR